jgi:serine/threonine protein kinase
MGQSPCPMCDRRHAGDCAEPLLDARIGQLVDGKYHVLRRLACGGMGSVYEARHAVIGRHFAIKFLHEHYARRTSMVQRFLREAQAAGSIASEHIIGVLDYGAFEGTPYLVMELVQGQDLREILTETPRLPVERAVRIIIDACRGLELAHERGLVHRDLKPANICVTRRSDGREVAKVIDFGVAKLRDGADLSEEGTLIGTLGYMAPEQLTDQKELDARADIYALGVILYQALAGRPPHLCNRSELLYRIISVDPRPLHELCSELPAGLSDVVHRALLRNKERRYPSAREFARALQEYSGEPAQAGTSRGAPPSKSSIQPTAGPVLGTAPTELESAPTWVALTAAENVKADRQCQPLSAVSSGGAGVEQFCRHPGGVAPLPIMQQRHQHLSQRAIAFSVGALALSVVAMTTMFIFVYSHGSDALEAGAAYAGTARARASAQMLAKADARGADPSTASTADESAQPAKVCAQPTDPLRRAPVIELASQAEAGLSIALHALEAAPTGGDGRHGAAALDCD